MKFALISLIALSEQVAMVAGVRGSPFLSTHRLLQKETEPQKACREALDGADVDGIECECVDLSADETSLTCLDIACFFCNADDSVCGTNSFEETFGLLGETTYLAEDFAYTRGLTDTLTVAALDCTFDEETEESVCDACTVMVNDVECDSCVLANCTSGQVRPSFDCSSIEAGAVYSLCDDSSIPAGSVFEPLNQSDDAFKVCQLATPAPTMTASATPSGMPSGRPSDSPSLMPSGMPSTSAPSVSTAPTANATMATMAPTATPTVLTSAVPTMAPQDNSAATATPTVMGDPTTDGPTSSTENGSVSSWTAVVTAMAMTVATVLLH